MKIVLSAIVAAAMVLFVQAGKDIERDETPSVHWDYGADPGGQTHWGLLDPAYVVCDKGMHQSPINLNKDTIGTIAHCAMSPLVFDYKPIKNAIAHWNGHTVEVDWTSDVNTAHNNSITIGAKKFNLVQFHLHTPSEHRIHNRHADAELHMVHRNPEDGALAVVGVLLHVQHNSVPLFRYIDQLHKKVADAFTPISVSDTTPDGTPEATTLEAEKKEGEENKDEEEYNEDEDEDEENQDQNHADFESQVIDWNLTDDESELVVGQDSLTTENNGGGSDCRHPPINEDLICSGGTVFGEDAMSVVHDLKSFDFSPLIRAVGNFAPRWEYQGSLTTPPCSEHVSWNIMHNSYAIGLDQLKALVALQGFNARDIHEDKVE